MNLKTAGMILATTVAPMTAKTPKAMKSASAALPKIEKCAQQAVTSKKGEVKVGMEFGDYSHAIYYAQMRPNVHRATTETYVSEGIEWTYDITKNKKNEDITAGTYSYNLKTKVTHGYFDDPDRGLGYSGYTSKPTFEDVKFSRIFGKEYSAVDKNGNGKVDPGEIYHNSKPPKGDASGKYDEKNYNLDLSVGFSY